MSWIEIGAYTRAQPDLDYAQFILPSTSNSGRKHKFQIGEAQEIKLMQR